MTPASKDLYEILGVSREASPDEIRRAYRDQARKLHPDVNKADDAQARFSEVLNAYEVLSNEEQRKAYDQFGHAGPGVYGRGGGARPGGGWSDARAHHAGEEDLSDIFEHFFGKGSPYGAGAAGPGRPAGPRPQSGADLERTIRISFMTAAMGGQEQIRITRDGSPETIEVKIPPGIDSGAKLRVRGKGAAGSGGGSAGDVILTIEVGDHPTYRREGANLFVPVPINIAEATLGTTVEVPLLGSGSVSVKIPAGTSGGGKLRIKGRGIDQGSKGRGDLFVEVQIVAPDTLSPRARELVEELQGELQNPRE